MASKKSSTSTPASSQSSEIIELDKAVEILKTSRSTLYRWVREGRIRAQKAGRQWRFEREEIDRFLKGEEPRMELRADITPLLEVLEARISELGASPSVSMSDSDLSHAVRLILDLGTALRASDIHVAPNLDESGRTDRAVVRFRVDGVLHPLIDFDVRLLPPLVAQWKMVFSCNPAETAKPQDGVLKYDGDSGTLAARAHFVPTILGPSVTARLLATAEVVPTLDKLGLSASDMERLQRAMRAPTGLILVTGPAGCGKTTTVYASLKQIAGPSRKTLTIEDPVEVVFPWMTQLQQREAEGFTIARAIVSMHRSDPDVMFICELANAEIAHLAVMSALTGHLVFSTLHRAHATEALERLRELGTEPFVVADVVKLVMAQRLARALCPRCSESAPPEADLLAKARETARKGGIDPDRLQPNWRRPVGCTECKGIGYRGRIPVTEVLEVTPEVAQAIRRGGTASEIGALAIAQGMTTIEANAVRRAAEGTTTLEEVMRIFASAF